MTRNPEGELFRFTPGLSFGLEELRFSRADIEGLTAPVDYATWRVRRLWTLIEAACLLSGRNPVPWTKFQKDRVAGGLAATIYADLKDAIDLGDVQFTESRDNTWQHRRVQPAHVVQWALARSVAVPPALVDSPTQQQQASDVALDADDTTPTSDAPDCREQVGVSKADILAAEWPLGEAFNQDSFENALGDVPKWLESARVSRGLPGNRGRSSAKWNPAQLAECLVSKGYASERSLRQFIKVNFPEYLGEWERSDRACNSGIAHETPAPREGEIPAV